MRIFRSLKKVSVDAISIGMFDGLHLGHQKILKTLKENGKAAIITFSNIKDPIYSEEKKLKLLKKAGIDIVFILDLDKTLSYIKFLEKLKENLNFKYLVLGKGASFGHMKRGDEKNVKKLEKKLNFKSIYIEKVKVEGEVVSSRLIKKFLKMGDRESIKKFL